MQSPATQKLLELPDGSTVIARHYLSLSQAARAAVESSASRDRQDNLKQQLCSAAAEGLHSKTAESRLDAVRAMRALSTMPPNKEMSDFLQAESDPAVLGVVLPE